MKIVVTGGAGFIGSALVRLLVQSDHEVVCVDALTYAGNLDSLEPVRDRRGFALEVADICDAPAMARILREHQPSIIIHLAAESHVDRSIDGPSEFVRSNVVGTQVLLEAATNYWRGLEDDERDSFRFHHVSTDEVFGDLTPEDAPFSETTAYAPSSPYAATKAASDHLARAWHRTYGLPVVISNCSNNYGPYQFPEKLIPHMILRALSGDPLPVYGDGAQIRDWLYVDDHARALALVAFEGRIGETYLIGGEAERKNIDVVLALCQILDELAPDRLGDRDSFASLITYVVDRPGHDRRYAVDCGKIERELGWQRVETLESGLKSTVAWYLNNEDWWQRVVSGEYRLQRLGEAGDAP